MPSEDCQLLTTGQAAELCSVKPDTIRKWIKRGRLVAMRTGGGHHRIALRQLAPYITQPDMKEGLADDSLACAGAPIRCWDYLSDQGQVRESCKECVVYRIRAAWCFAVAEIDCDIGHSRQFCGQSCEDCLYFQRMKGRAAVLVVSEERDMLLADEDEEAGVLDLRFASNAYQVSALLNQFKPLMVVVDQALPANSAVELLGNLAADPRVPGIKCALAVNRGKLGRVALPPSVQLELEKPFTHRLLRNLLDRFPVELPEPGELETLKSAK